jgi:hypothetical protein
MKLSNLGLRKHRLHHAMPSEERDERRWLSPWPAGRPDPVTVLTACRASPNPQGTFDFEISFNLHLP